MWVPHPQAGKVAGNLGDELGYPYSARISPENTQKLVGFYMEGLILGVNTMYMLFSFLKLFPIGCI